MEIANCLICNFNILSILLIVVVPINGQIFLSVSGRNLTLNDEKVFLSGMNQAWYNYARDFGHKMYEKSRPHLLKTLDEIDQSGGNSVRIWLHTTGARTPRFNARGYVTGLDRQFRRNMVDFVKQAQERNILVTFTLWNCAGNKEKDFPVFGLLREEGKLQSYIKKALPKLVRAVRPYQAMGIWDIINEPEGCVIPDIKDTVEPCYDTSALRRKEGAGWTYRNISLERILRFVGLHAHVIHREDPKTFIEVGMQWVTCTSSDAQVRLEEGCHVNFASHTFHSYLDALVTVGSWNYKSITNQLGRRDFYTDECLRKASGGLEGARIDLYQIHTYDNWVEYPHDAPFKVDASLYALEKPLIIGEFSQRRGGMMTSEKQFLWAYRHGYSGAWSWCARQGAGESVDDVATQMRGMKSLKGKNDQSEGGRVDIKFKEIDPFIKRFTRNMSKIFKDVSQKLISI